MKVLTLVLHFYTNLAASSAAFTFKMLRETSIVHIFQYILQNNIVVGNDEIMMTIMRFTELIATNYNWEIEEGTLEVD